MRVLALIAALTACTEHQTALPPPAHIDVAGSAWVAERVGDAPTLRGPGDMYVFVDSAKSGDRLPGISLGSAAGPSLTLLAGQFAPLVIPDQSRAQYAVRIEARGSTLSIAFGDAFVARVLPEQRALVIEGRASLVLPAGQTQVRGFREGRPSFEERVDAWSVASVEPRTVDRIEVDTERRGSVAVESTCAPRLLRPRARANTSSFVIRLGPPRDDFDALYAPADAEDRAPPCTGTATVWVRPEARTP